VRPDRARRRARRVPRVRGDWRLSARSLPAVPPAGASARRRARGGTAAATATTMRARIRAREWKTRAADGWVHSLRLHSLRLRARELRRALRECDAARTGLTGGSAGDRATAGGSSQRVFFTKVHRVYSRPRTSRDSTCGTCHVHSPLVQYTTSSPMQQCASQPAREFK
jgi:hypothetical protein